MYALTIHQPWAWAIAAGHKLIENRSWGTSYRGPLAIHAGTSLRSLDRGFTLIRSLSLSVPDDLPLGVIVAVVDLIDVLPVAAVESPWASGPLCWVLANPRPLDYPIPHRGMPGLWTAPELPDAQGVPVRST